MLIDDSESGFHGTIDGSVSSSSCYRTGKFFFPPKFFYIKWNLILILFIF